MVVGSAGLRFLLMILCFRGFRSGAYGQLQAPQVLGLRLEEPSEGVYMRERVITAPYGASFKLRLFGLFPANGTGTRTTTTTTWPWVGFAVCAGADADGISEQDPCEQEKSRSSALFQVSERLDAAEPEGYNNYYHYDGENSSRLVTVTVRTRRGRDDGGDGGGSEEGIYHRVCVLDGARWASVGRDKLRAVGAGGETPSDDDDDDADDDDMIPTWALAVAVVLVLAACALLKSVNLSLLWLDPLELYVLHSCGSEREKRAAKRLEPVRRRGNLLVCSLLLLCALGHAALGALLQRAFGSVAPAVLVCGALLFLVAELLPHVLCSGHGFQLAPRLTWLAQVCMVLTCPLSCPLGLLLDVALRRDVSTCGVRERTMEMIRTNVNDPYNEFVKEEFSRGALRSKTVEDILTPLKDCFMLPSTAVLDFNTMSEIMQSGYTRVPVYEDERSNIVEILYVKDLALVDPEDCTPMSTITKFYNHPLHFVFNDTKLDAMLEEFKKGNSHMAIVQKVNNEGEGDPFYEVLGLVTLEDVIEEIIKSEILDESDGYMETKVKRPLAPLEISLEPRSSHEEFSLFRVSEGEPKIRTSPQLLLATHRFLSREVEHFSPHRVSEKVLFHLLRHPSVNQEVKFDPSNRMSPDHYLYTRNHPVDYFILLLQGRVEVEIGKEGLKFENGAFTYYGVSALTAPSSVHQSPVSTQRRSPKDPFDLGEAASPSSYCPDYTVRALTDLQLIRVTRLQYLNALMASRVTQSPDPPEIKILPNSQTKLLNERNTNIEFPVHFSFFDKIENYC
ncbi:metal transporter CNNM3 isoform X2 [Scleropages formosus]|uniref:Metal transporter n=1 Tax=Scleropages formosus TaxID=113540 RepID=A0A8C9TVI4_SCLFO|nr:metal transporter CNNM3-like isoform X2 [Scleropages formosus]XP_029108689.1 metal transporter CNNM3-like isoform X2 [Scleropages formosus]